jgi:hypothetical protein
MTPKPWGKIFAILAMSAAVMGIFVWKYLDTLKDSKAGNIGHLPSVLKPLYNVLGEEMFLVFGAVATLLFAAVGLKAVMGRPSDDD